jgi:hypothetical protein
MIANKLDQTHKIHGLDIIGLTNEQAEEFKNKEKIAIEGIMIHVTNKKKHIVVRGIKINVEPDVQIICTTTFQTVLFITEMDAEIDVILIARLVQLRLLKLIPKDGTYEQYIKIYDTYKNQLQCQEYTYTNDGQSNIRYTYRVTNVSREIVQNRIQNILNKLKLNINIPDFCNISGTNNVTGVNFEFQYDEYTIVVNTRNYVGITKNERTITIYGDSVYICLNGKNISENISFSSDITRNIDYFLPIFGIGFCQWVLNNNIQYDRSKSVLTLTSKELIEQYIDIENIDTLSFVEDKLHIHSINKLKKIVLDNYILQQHCGELKIYLTDIYLASKYSDQNGYRIWDKNVHIIVGNIIVQNDRIMIEKYQDCRVIQQVEIINDVSIHDIMNFIKSADNTYDKSKFEEYSLIKDIIIKIVKVLGFLFIIVIILYTAEYGFEAILNEKNDVSEILNKSDI